MNKKVLIALPLALMLTVGLTACGSKTPSGDKEPDKVVEYVDKDYVDVTAIGGTIKGKEYSHDKIEKNQNVTIVAPAAIGTQRFDGWYNGNEKVSSEAEYTFQATEHITLTARYDGNTLSVWDGEYPETVSNQATTAADGGYVADFENKTWHITSAAGLAYWAKLVSAHKTGNPECSYVFSAFDKGVYNITPGDNAAKVKAAYNPDNAWTLSLECDVDLDYQEWNPIVDWNQGLFGMTFEGNGHTISNLYAVNKADAVVVPYYTGFFGAIYGNDFTMRNVTFDGAYLTSPESASGNQWGGVAIGVLTSGDYNAIFGQPNTTIMENVNVTNAFIGGQGTTKSGFLIGVTGQYAAFPGANQPGWVNGNDNSVIILRNCNVTNGTMLTRGRSGGLVGYINHAVDSDPGIGAGDEELRNGFYDSTLDGAITKPIPQISIVYRGCSISNINVLVHSATWAKATFGTLGCVENAGLEGAPVVKHDIDNAKNVNVVSLNTNTGNNIALTSDTLLNILNADHDKYTGKAAIVCRDIEITAEQLENIETIEGIEIFVLEGVNLTLPQDCNIKVYTLKTSEVDSDGYAAVYEGETKKGIFNNGLVLPESAE